MTALRSFDATCATHRWPLRGDGGCALCERDAAAGRAIPPCPSHTTWPRAVKEDAWRLYMLAMRQTGTHDERMQHAWEHVLDVAGRDLGLVYGYVTPPAVTLERYIDHLNRTPAAAGKER